MTPRQEAAARKRIAKLQAMCKRAMAPTMKRLERNHAAYLKSVEKLRKTHEQKRKPLDRKLSAIAAKFEKRIGAIARKL